MFNKLKEIINLKQRKKISVLNFMLVEKNNSISKLKKEVMRLTDLCNNYHTEKTAYKNQVDVYQEEIAKKDMQITNFQND